MLAALPWDYTQQQGWSSIPPLTEGYIFNAAKHGKAKSKSTRGPHMATLKKLSDTLLVDHDYNAPPLNVSPSSGSRTKIESFGDCDTSDSSETDEEDEVCPSKRKDVAYRNDLSSKPAKVLDF
ncbi:hypothetical protein NDU88_006360 [Pleurodeles waltl]|uniref:Uncharacterized protein n=1 Tax=Pleurodeles waltl TaxID=8319 RepID=A0AAV7WEK4_PLEWA|nr:hypothetical protein NDU88_006360 [Pleurodeles waltl]